ncbi:MAG: glycosyltransferase, partial [Kiritimatiellae bacterium]|nr:glycosyltransferase [Kiritimatiellia bacterium]
MKKDPHSYNQTTSMGHFERLLRDAGYRLDHASEVWHRPTFQGIPYTDGAALEARIGEIVSHAQDVSVLSPELRLKCNDWPSLYHLSGSRANIVRPLQSQLTGNILEIGSGCGAITRFLGECGANVLALEGSLARAAITRSRTRDLGNVVVVAEDFNTFACTSHFDIITLIGVLEYAHMYSASANPTTEMLSRVRRLLKPDGKLVLAIENQLGLKYFAGAPEDHLGEPVYGIEGRYREKQPHTFGRKHVARMLTESGYQAVSFLLPFPDYKIPVSIITEEGLHHEGFDAAAFAWQTVHDDVQLPSISNFSMELAWREVGRNGMMLELANAFLVLASPTPRELIPTRILAFHYSTQRLPAYCRETVFEVAGTGSDIRVQYRALGELATRSRVKDAWLQFVCPDQAAYVHGELLSWQFIRTVTQDGWDMEEVGAFLKHYVAILLDMVGVSQSCPPTALPGSFVDMVPQNIMVCPDGRCAQIDTEWRLTCDIELGWLLWRALFLMLCKVTRFGRYRDGRTLHLNAFIHAALHAAGFRYEEAELRRFARLEADIQSQVTGRPLTELADWPPDLQLPTQNSAQLLAHYQTLFEGSAAAHVQVFWQTPRGFEEAASLRTVWPSDGQEHTTVCRFLDDIHGRVRIDPAESCCLMLFHTIEVKDTDGKVHALPWPPAAVAGDAVLVPSDSSRLLVSTGSDPIIEFDLPPEGARLISWTACKMPVIQATADHVMRALRAQDRRIGDINGMLAQKDAQIHEMATLANTQRDQISTLVQSLGESQQHLASLHGHLVAKDAALATLSQHLDARENRLSQMVHAVEDRSTQLAALTRDVLTLNQTLADRDSHVAALSQSASHHEAQVSILTRDLAAAAETIDARTRQISSLTAEAAQRTAETSALAAKLALRDTDIAVRDARIGSLSQTAAQQEAEISSLKQAMAQHDADLVKVAQSTAQQAVDLSALRQVLVQRDAELAARDARVATLTEASAHHVALVAKLTQDLAKRDAEAGVIQQTCAIAEQQLKELRSCRGWHHAKRFQHVVDTLLPANTIRSRLANAVFRSVRRVYYHRIYRLVEHSGLFDKTWYISQYKDAAKCDADPVWHYIEQGAREGRNPSSGFDGNAYLHMHPDVARSGANPLVHYLTCGEKEGRSAVMGDYQRVRRSRLFDAAWYCKAYPDIAKAKIDPLQHYLDHGAREGRDPGPHFHTKWYLDTYADVAAAGMNPLLHYLTNGRKEGRHPRYPVVPSATRTARVCLFLREMYRHLPIAVATRSRHRAFVTRHAPWVMRQLRPIKCAMPLPTMSTRDDAGAAENDDFGEARKLVLVSHNATPSGAPMIALNVARTMRETFKIKLAIILLDGGNLSDEFARYGEVVNLWGNATDSPQVAQLVTSLRARGYDKAICNTVVSGDFAHVLKQAGFTVMTLIHEMGSSITTNQWVEQARMASRHSDIMVFPSEIVRASYESVSGKPRGAVHIHPQGNYRVNHHQREAARATIRQQLGVSPNTTIVLGMGYGDHRKGVDIFVDTALAIESERLDLCFVWVGQLAPDMRPVVEKLQASAKHPNSIRFLGFTDQPEVFHAGSDIYLLTSREDPFPTVVMEAMDAGMPVVGWQAGGGYVDLLKEVGGVTIAKYTSAAFASAIKQLLANKQRCRDLGRRGHQVVHSRHNWRDYVNALQTQLGLQPRTVSVIIPNYNYARYFPERLASIVNQTYPVHEIVVLDDCSTDNSLDVIRQQLANVNIPHQVVVNKENAGVFKQWQRGVALAKGELVWIAEADDSCEPTLLAQLVPRFDNPFIGMAYAQSTMMDADGNKSRTYIGYLETDGEPGSSTHWRRDYVNHGQHEISEHLIIRNTIPNVSAAVIRRDILQRIGDQLGGGLQFAGDWYAYVQILEQGAISFCATPLNFHRHHADTVVARARSDTRQRIVQLLIESFKIESHILTRYPVDSKCIETARANRRMVCRLRLGCELEEVPELAACLSHVSAIKLRDAPKRILFFSTNDGWGGSEVNCAKIAKHFSDEHYRVALCMRRHRPRPVLLNAIAADGVVTLQERNELDFCRTALLAKFVLEFNPQIVFLSHGHAFEGLDMMRWCRHHELPYVNYIPLPNETMLQHQTP